MNENRTPSRISESANRDVALIALAWEIVNTSGSNDNFYPNNLKVFIRVHTALLTHAHSSDSIDKIMEEFNKNDKTSQT